MAKSKKTKKDIPNSGEPVKLTLDKQVQRVVIYPKYNPLRK